MKNYKTEVYNLAKFKETICKLYCGNVPTKCQRDCNIKRLTVQDAEQKRLIDLFDFKPTEKANRLARKIRLHKAYQRTKERIKNNDTL